MKIFEEVKSRVSARIVAEAYGLKVSRHGMACCPFHNDKHPSMKIDDTHYHCFGCGAHGDVVGYVAAYFDIGQYEAAVKINEDFQLGLDAQQRQTTEEKIELQKQISARKRIADIREKLGEWKSKTIGDLLDCEKLIAESEKALMHEAPHVVFLTNGFVYMMHVKAILSYWLDVLCEGTEEEAKELFLTDGKEVSRVVANVRRAADDILGKARKRVG